MHITIVPEIIGFRMLSLHSPGILSLCSTLSIVLLYSFVRNSSALSHKNVQTSNGITSILHPLHAPPPPTSSLLILSTARFTLLPSSTLLFLSHVLHSSFPRCNPSYYQYALFVCHYLSLFIILTCPFPIGVSVLSIATMSFLLP